MNPTKQNLQDLAVLFCSFNGGNASDLAEQMIEWEEYEDEAPYTVTRETIDDFFTSAKDCWTLAKGRHETDKGIFWGQIQINKGNRRTAFAVLDCGDFRVCYAV